MQRQRRHEEGDWRRGAALGLWVGCVQKRGGKHGRNLGGTGQLVGSHEGVMIVGVSQSVKCIVVRERGVGRHRLPFASTPPFVFVVPVFAFVNFLPVN